MTKRKGLAIVAAVLVAALIAALAVWYFFFRSVYTITAIFGTSVGIYQGTEVRVLGMPVGRVTKVTPMGDEVKVDMKITQDIELPVDVGAVQVTPSLISDRFIQLTPVYSEGPKVESSHIDIPRERTREPVEVDEVYAAISNFTEALGPTQANANGAVTDLINTAHANLVGNGEAIGESISALADASRTLSENRGDFFQTLKNLQAFATALAQNDAQVRQFNTEMASFTNLIANQRGDLEAAINQLSFTLDEVATFVNENREALAQNVDGLAPVMGRIAQETDALNEVILTAPLASSNLANAYDAESGTLQIRPNLYQLQDIGGTLCHLLELQNLYPGDPRYQELGRQVQPLVDECRSMIDQINAGIKTPGVRLPFGIMSNREDQLAGPVPGTVPGNPSPRVTQEEIDRAGGGG
jgi:phospholipid/cholesterol/gamma-HCH transport system substrate-binding protein